MIDTSKPGVHDASSRPAQRSLKHALHRYRFLLLALLVVCVLPLTLRSGSLATEVLVFALAALGCNLLLGHTGLLSFGQGIFFGLGSYCAGLVLTKTAMPIPVALLAAIVIGGAAAALVGWFSIRQRGTYFVMLTLAFGQLFYFLAYTTPDLTGGDNGLLDIPRPALGLFGKALVPLTSPWQYYAFVAVLFLVVFWLLMRVSHSVFGRTLLAIRDNEARAAAVGYDVKRFKLMAFVISGAVTGLAGALHALMTGIAPLSNIDYHTSEMILVMTVIGGTGNLFASVLGAAFYVLFADWLSTLWPRWLLLLGIVLIAVSLFMQRGLWGLGERIWQALRRDRPTDADNDTGNSADNHATRERV
ncbi:branched-chain amino acid ABC transporter permease [Paraburkholderia nemoris]|uniref:branched-chain amino acid ABC transporter permease n=1 Tax=Paraburkholderia nemoris TaxID=2793076 RepID=UPI0038BE1E07